MIDWPTAAVMLGALATLCVGLIQWPTQRREPTNGRIYASAVELAEIKAKLQSLDESYRVMRDEIRADLKELEALIRNQ